MTNVFLKIGDIQGESSDDRHADEIDVVSWSWGLAQAGSIASSTGGGTGRVEFSDLSFTHHLDKASPDLMRACATGTHVKEAILTQRKAGGQQQDYLVVRMTEVMVTSVQSSAAGDEGSALEQVSLQFAGVDLEYKPQRPDGSLDESIHFVYDLTTNRVG